MYKFQSKCTMAEIEVAGTDGFGCVNPIRGRLFFDSEAVSNVLKKMEASGENLVCMTYLDKGRVESHFISVFTIITDKDEHLCINQADCFERTRRMLIILDINSELKDLLEVAGAA